MNITRWLSAFAYTAGESIHFLLLRLLAPDYLLAQIGILSATRRDGDIKLIHLSHAQYTIRGIKHISGWRCSPHSNVTHTPARLFASANRHPERSPRCEGALPIEKL